MNNIFTTRRYALKLGTALSAGLCLSSCAHSQNQPGVIRYGAIGSTSAITQDPFGVLSNDSDMAIMSLVYDALTVPGVSDPVIPRLATSWESDSHQKNWIFHINPQATFHDHTPVTADDVVWSLQTLARISPAKVPVIPESIRSLSLHSVAMRTQKPTNQLPLLLRLMSFTLKAHTHDRTNFMGTGPFRYQPNSYRDGNISLRANPTWYGGKPKVAGIDIYRFADTSSLLNAILTKQIDVAANVGPLAARAAHRAKNLNIIQRPNDIVIPLAIRMIDSPLAHPDVITAIKYAVDRKALIRQVFSGYGEICSDILGIGDPLYTHSIPQRPYDRTMARSLLKKSNIDLSTSYPLVTKAEATGEVLSAYALSEQLNQVGLRTHVVEVEPAVFYAQYWCTSKAPLYTVSWETNDSILFFANSLLLSQSTRNETGFSSSYFDQLTQKAGSTSDLHEIAQYTEKIQRIEYEQVGYLVWGVGDGIDLADNSVKNLPKNSGFGRMLLENTWIADAH